jgi:benzoate membrane transport protein
MLNFVYNLIYVYKMKISSFFNDISLSAISAGFIAVLVGYASALAIVYQGAIASGATPQMIESWIWALGIGMGVGCLVLSLYYKRPIVVAWSTSGAALLASSLSGASIEQAIGIFVFVGLLTLLTGLSGYFDTMAKSIPLPLASAMLAGILVQFGLSIFGALKSDPIMVGIMLATYLLSKPLLPRYAVLMVLIAGCISAYSLNSLNLQSISWGLASPIWVQPSFNLSLLIGVGLPLFVVTMSSQNMPGVAILNANFNSRQAASPLLTSIGGLNILLAPLGAFTLCLAAITQAICASDEAHPDPNKRYIAGVFAGIFNIIAGLCGATVVSLFAAFPGAMVAALAGLALLSTIGASLTSAFAERQYSEAALLTFLVTASGVSLFNIASAFWGIVIGLLALTISKLLKR